MSRRSIKFTYALISLGMKASKATLLNNALIHKHSIRIQFNRYQYWIYLENMHRSIYNIVRIVLFTYSCFTCLIYNNIITDCVEHTIVTTSLLKINFYIYLEQIS